MGFENAGRAFARPDMAEGELWIETLQTEAAMLAMYRVLDVSRLDDPGWQPLWVLCGDEGTGKSALVRRFAAQAQRSAACDALRDVEERCARETGTPKIPSPEHFEARDQSWARYREFRAMSPEERVRRFGRCPHVCRPVEILPKQQFQSEVARLGTADPVGIGEMPLRPKRAKEFMQRDVWNTRGNWSGDPLRRTSLFFVDDADHLTRLSEARRTDVLEEMRLWPKMARIAKPVTFVLVGSPALADAVAACGATRTVMLPAMALDGAEGTFAHVCRLVFGTREPADLERLHGSSRGAMGPLLNVARLQGLRPPYNIPDGEVLRLPGPE